MGPDVTLKRPTLLYYFQLVLSFFFFFSVKKPHARRIGIFPLIKHLFRWFQCRAFVFYKKHLGDLSMITFLSRCSLYSCDIFLPTFCQYLGLKSCILTHRIQLCNPSPTSSLRSVMFLSHASGRSSQSGLVSAIRGTASACTGVVFVLPHSVFFFCVSPHSYSHMHYFVVDLTPKFLTLDFLITSYFISSKKKTQKAYFEYWQHVLRIVFLFLRYQKRLI